MRIKALREKQNLSQQDLAQETGVSCTTIDQWEKGEALPDKSNHDLQALARYFHVSVGYLLGNEEMKIRSLRTKKRLSQQALADKLGVARSTVAMWEKGSSEPDNRKLKILADIFNVSVDYLLGREKETLAGFLDKALSDTELALHGEVRNLTEEQKKDILNYVLFIKSKNSLKK